MKKWRSAPNNRSLISSLLGKGKGLALLGLAALLLMGVSCTLYQSDDRKFLENDRRPYFYLSSGFRVEPLKDCSSSPLPQLAPLSEVNWSQFAERPMGLQDQLLTWGWVNGSELLILTAHKTTGQGCLAQFQLDSAEDVELAVEDFLFASSERLVGL